MKNSETKNQETIQKQVRKFKVLLWESKLSIIGTVCLIALSAILIYYSRESLVSIISLTCGASLLITYLYKFLWLRGINRNFDTLDSINSSFSTYKTYMKKRKNNEILYISIWILSIVPAATLYFGSSSKAFVFVFLSIFLVIIVGVLSFNKIIKIIENMERKINLNPTNL